MFARTNVWIISLLSLTVALAGCTDGEVDDGSSAVGDGDGGVKLGNQGAINGLIVDDNYRPVQLKEEWGTAGPGDYQDVGFVLVLETASRFETNENGEFQAIPLDPGTYTLRVAADNHEAIDKKVQVVAGEFAEVTIEARRTFSGGGTILSQDHVVFIQCSANAGYIGATNIFCGDTSGDGQRAAFETSFSDLKDDIRGMVTEMRAHDSGYYSFDIRTPALSCPSYNNINGCLYSRVNVDNGVYLKSVLYPHMQWRPDGTYLEEGQEGYCSPEDYDKGAEGCGPYFAWTLQQSFDTILFPDTANRYWTDQAYDAAQPPVNRPWGFGPQLGVKAQFVQNVFLYELPEEGITEYCVLCDDADIPE